MSGDQEGTRPLLRVIAGGEPTDEELAALVAAVSVLVAPAADSRETNQSRWADRSAALRRPLRPGPGAWRASARRN